MPDRKKRIRGNDPTLGQPRRRHGMRSLVIRGDTWQWRFGHRVQIRAPDGGSHDIGLDRLVGRDWNDLEEASWNRSLSVDPSTIVDHIDRRIPGYTDQDGFPAGSAWRGYQAPVRKGSTTRP